MGHGRITGIEREARLIELREAWFDGWVSGIGSPGAVLRP